MAKMKKEMKVIKEEIRKVTGEQKEMLKE